MIMQVFYKFEFSCPGRLHLKNHTYVAVTQSDACHSPIQKNTLDLGLFVEYL